MRWKTKRAAHGSSEIPAARAPSASGCNGLAAGAPIRVQRGFRKLWGALVASSWALGCASTPTASLPAAPLLTHEAPDKPPLVVIEREGDALAGIAWAGSVRAGHAALSALGDAAARELGRAGFAARLRVSDDALLVASELPDQGAARRWLAALQRGLFEAELGAPASGARVDPCTFPQVEPVDPSRLRAALGFDNSALAVVGGEATIQAVAAAHADSAAWPEGEDVVDPWPERDQVSSQASAAGERLSVALRLGDGGIALAAARTIGRPDSTLRLLAAAAAPGWRLERVSASLRPSGGCLLADFSAGAALHAVHVSRAAQSFADELRYAARQSARLEPTSAARQAADPVEAAQRAAWGVLAGRVEPGDEPRLHVRHAGSSPVADLATRLADPVRVRLEPSFRVERGQGRSWALLTSDCPTAHEDAASAGHTAALLLAAAGFAASEQSPIRVEPWVSSEGLGLIASVPAGTDGQLIPLVEELGRALLAADSDPSWQSVAREELMSARIPSPGWELGLRLASEGHPSQLVPAGVRSSLAQLTPSAGSRALRGFIGGKLRLAVLTPASDSAVRAATRRLQGLLVPLGAESHGCKLGQRVANVGGHYLSSEASDTEALLLFPIRPERIDVARAAAELLNLPGGWLDRAVVTPGLATAARAMALGNHSGYAALAVAIHAESAVLMDAVAQARGLFERLSRAHFGRAALAALQARRAREAWAGNDPRERLVRLVSPPEAPLSDARLREFFGRELSPERLIVVGPGAVAEPQVP